MTQLVTSLKMMFVEVFKVHSKHFLDENNEPCDMIRYASLCAFQIINKLVKHSLPY